LVGHRSSSSSRRATPREGLATDATYAVRWSLYLRVSVVWSEVEAKSVLGGIRFWDRHEQEAGKAILGGMYLKLVGVVVDDYPAERFSPPLPERALGSRASTIVCSQIRVTTLIVEAERRRPPLTPGRWDETRTDRPDCAEPASEAGGTERRGARSASLKEWGRVNGVRRGFVG
jgi:hypothetical protein